MTQIPESLRQLWAARDRAAGRQPVSLESIDEYLSEEPVEPSSKPLVPPTPLLREITPIPNMPLFPTYSLTPPTVSLATYHVRTDKLRS